MITIKQLQPTMVSISANLKGIRTYPKDLTINQLEKQIEADISSNLDDINKINIDVESEDFEDDRTFKECVLINVEMLIQFKVKIEDKTVELIKKFLESSLVSNFN